MKILIIGAGGMVGQKLVYKLLEPNFNAFNINEICLFDLYLPKYKDTRTYVRKKNYELVGS